MHKLFWHFFIYTLTIAAADFIIPGISTRGPFDAPLAGAVMALAGLLIRPWLVLLSLPLSLVTMGLLVPVINALLVLLAALVVGGLEVAGFWPALGVSVPVTLVDYMLRNMRRAG